MFVRVKTLREIGLMREIDRFLAKVHNEPGNLVRPEMSKYVIDKTEEAVIRSFGCESLI